MNELQAVVRAVAALIEIAVGQVVAQAAQAFLAGAHRFLCGDAGADVLDDDEDAVQAAIRLANGLRGDTGVDALAVGAQVALLQFEAVFLSPCDAFEGGQAGRQVVGMSQFGPGHVFQLVGRIAEYLAERGVDDDPAFLGIVDRHADGRAFEINAEAGFCFLLAPAVAGHQGRQDGCQREQEG